MVDWYNLLVHRRRGAPDDWRWVELKAIDNGIMCRGAVYTEVFKSGPRKGQPNWAKRNKDTEREYFITMAELHEFQLEWEKETGKCHNCDGTGQRFSGWNSKTGKETKPCERCNATGTSPMVGTK